MARVRAMPSSLKLQIFSARTSMQPLSFWSVPSTTSELAERIGTAERFVELRTNDHVNDAGFVFEGQEYEALRGAGTLSRDDEPADATSASRRQIGKTGGRYDAQLARDARGNAPSAGRPVYAGRPQIERRKPLGRDGFKANGAVRRRPSRAELAARFAFVDAAQRPHRFAPRSVPRRERTGDGEVLERFASPAACAARNRAGRRTRLPDRRFEPLSLRLAHAAHEMETQAQRAVGSTCDHYSLAFTSIGLTSRRGGARR